MSPVLHEEGCRILLGSVVVHHHLSGSLVCMSLWLSTLSIVLLCLLYFVSFSDALTFSSSSLSVLLRPRLKASLPCAILTDSGS
jgi:hypothetical protein